MFVVSVIRDDREPAFEFAVLTQLLEGEAKCCQHCQQIFEQTSCLPMHCQICDRHRGERCEKQRAVGAEVPDQPRVHYQLRLTRAV